MSSSQERPPLVLTEKFLEGNRAFMKERQRVKNLPQEEFNRQLDALRLLTRYETGAAVALRTLGLQPLIRAFVDRVSEEQKAREYDELPPALRNAAYFSPNINPNQIHEYVQGIIKPSDIKKEVTLSFLKGLMIDWGIAENEQDADNKIKIYKRDQALYSCSDAVVAASMCSKHSQVLDRRLGTKLEPEQVQEIVSGNIVDEDLIRTETERLVDEAYLLSNIYMELANADEDTNDVVDGLREIGEKLRELGYPVEDLHKVNTPLHLFL